GLLTTSTRAPSAMLFIFGDSLVDNGNNNAILTLARANYRPYGIDFPQGTTGRFTNGRTFVDLNFLDSRTTFPPYARTRGRALLMGANYASGAAGIRDETGNNLALYNLGARKVIVTGVGQIGCIPYQLARYDANGNGSRCNEEINSAIVVFNSGLQTMVDCFNKGQLPGAKFVYLNAFETTKDLVLSASSYGKLRPYCYFPYILQTSVGFVGIVGTFMQNIGFEKTLKF
ncbi:hypothetical protein RJ640_024237, partial [Escallonia rubra]